MASTDRAFDRGTRVGLRHLGNLGGDLRERRMELGLSQQHVADAAHMSRSRYCRVEAGSIRTFAVLELDQIAAILGLDAAVRLYPGGVPSRDAAHSGKLQGFLRLAARPLSHRVEVPLPPIRDRPEQRAWDAVLFGRGARTAIELEMRLRDVQALLRRIDLKRRDDPTERFLLLVADTRQNRRVLAEFAGLFAELPRLRPSKVRRALLAGAHPPTGLLLV